MDISAVSSSVTAAANPQVRQPPPSPQDQQSLQALQAQRAQNARNTPAVDENEAASRTRVEAERNRPTVNTSGQLVGTQINVTA